MNDFLTQMLGANTAGVGQFLVIAAIAVVVIVLLYMLVRRLSRIRVSGIARGRVPRLAVVDAVAIDSRRQLVLVRRDAVEHLILIGGPTDLMVEPSIVRPRQRQAQAVPAQPAAAPPSLASAAAAAAAPALASPIAAQAVIAAPVAEGTAAYEAPPLPFPFSRLASSRPAASVSNGHGASDDRQLASDFAPSPPWATLQPDGGTLPILDAGPGGAGAASLLTERSGAIADELPSPFGLFRNGGSDGHKGGSSASPGTDPRRLPATEESAAHKVSELEAEMNRLLVQLAGDRRSS